MRRHQNFFGSSRGNSKTPRIEVIIDRIDGYLHGLRLISRTVESGDGPFFILMQFSLRDLLYVIHRLRKIMSGPNLAEPKQTHVA